MRLGTDDDARALDCALALEAGGAHELVVHGRTRAQGYRPPAYWHRIGDVRAAVRIPVVANGEIWTLADAQRCLAESGCDSLMLGRGMVSDPGLAGRVQGVQSAVSVVGPDAPSLNWADIQALFQRFWCLVQVHTEPRYQAGRLKQWLNLLRRRYPEAEVAYQALRTENHAARLAQALLTWDFSSVSARYTADMPSGALCSADPSDAPSNRHLHGCSLQGESDLRV
jgi:tRNA-dihydrouridine synthase C